MTARPTPLAGCSRSVLFAPGNHPRRAGKALASGADVVVLDLEDAVPAAEKAAARSVVAGVLQGDRRARVYLRVNAVGNAECEADMRLAAACGVEGVVVPKVDNAAVLAIADRLLDGAEREHGLVAGALEVMPIIESAAAVANCDSIACASSRVSRMIFGGADYSLDLDISLDWTPEEQELLYARARLAHASRVARIEAPIDTATLAVRDLERFVRSARNGRTLGFQGKLCLHPDQIEPCHTVFTPSVEELAHARRVLAAFRDAAARGSAATELDGQFIDEPVAERARRMLRRAKLSED